MNTCDLPIMVLGPQYIGVYRVPSVTQKIKKKKKKSLLYLSYPPFPIISSLESDFQGTNAFW